MVPCFERLETRSTPSVPVGVIAAVICDPPPVQREGARMIDSAFDPLPVGDADLAAILLQAIK